MTNTSIPNKESIKMKIPRVKRQERDKNFVSNGMANK